MVSIEVFFAIIVFIFSLIGLARGFLKELGVTAVIMFLLLFLSKFEPYLDRGMVKMLSMSTRISALQNHGLMQCWLYVFVLVGATFISYQGETLAYGGQPLRGAQGILLGWLTGLLNGYLVAGSLWFYMDKFNYPIAFLGFSADKLSPFARELVPFLPLAFLGQPVLFGQGLLLYLTGLLLLARVIR